MATVEELREDVVRRVDALTSGDASGIPDIKTITFEQRLDSLIAAANEEGCDDGWAASKMLWTRMQEWNDEWRKENPKERSLTLLDAMDLIEWKIAKARAEGAEAERERIRGNSQMVGVDSESVNFIGSVDSYVGSAFLVPVDVMDPPLLAPDKENEK